MITPVIGSTWRSQKLVSGDLGTEAVEGVNTPAHTRLFLRCPTARWPADRPCRPHRVPPSPVPRFPSAEAAQFTVREMEAAGAGAHALAHPGSPEPAFRRLPEGTCSRNMAMREAPFFTKAGKLAESPNQVREQRWIGTAGVVFALRVTGCELRVTGLENAVPLRLPGRRVPRRQTGWAARSRGLSPSGIFNSPP